MDKMAIPNWSGTSKNLCTSYNVYFTSAGTRLPQCKRFEVVVAFAVVEDRIFRYHFHCFLHLYCCERQPRATALTFLPEDDGVVAAVAVAAALPSYCCCTNPLWESLWSSALIHLRIVRPNPFRRYILSGLNPDDDRDRAEDCLEWAHLHPSSSSTLSDRRRGRPRTKRWSTTM